VDDEGYLVARSGFHEPVGPTYSQRGTHVEEMQGEAN
jgi:ubiquinol-cytochrome c reductase iron-sulfur subunit